MTARARRLCQSASATRRLRPASRGRRRAVDMTDDLAAELARVPGAVVTECPDPACDATVGGGARIIEHHDDGSHTMDWGGEVPELVETIDGLDVWVSVLGVARDV